MEKTTIEERIIEAEKYLFKRLHENQRKNSDVLNTVYFILRSKGLISVAELCNKVNISQRQLQRLFLEFVGVSPKKAIDLVRFQNVRRDMYYSRIQDFSDIVYYYNYTDQSHFHNNFRKYAGRTPREALEYAKS